MPPLVVCSFGDLQNYTTLKPSHLYYPSFKRFGDLQNYTTLKLTGWGYLGSTRFGDLQNYTTLKPILNAPRCA